MSQRWSQPEFVRRINFDITQLPFARGIEPLQVILVFVFIIAGDLCLTIVLPGGDNLHIVAKAPAQLDIGSVISKPGGALPQSIRGFFKLLVSTLRTASQITKMAVR
jgi:hypothetical protein